jgi:hypothetical protein
LSTREDQPVLPERSRGANRFVLVAGIGIGLLLAGAGVAGGVFVATQRQPLPAVPSPAVVPVVAPPPVVAAPALIEFRLAAQPAQALVRLETEPECNPCVFHRPLGAQLTAHITAPGFQPKDVALAFDRTSQLEVSLTAAAPTRPTTKSARELLGKNAKFIDVNPSGDGSPKPAADGAQTTTDSSDEVLQRARDLRSSGKSKDGLALVEEAVTRAEASGDRRALGHALRNRGNYAQDLQRCLEAEGFFKRSFGVFESVGDNAAAGLVANDLGLLGNLCEGVDRVSWFKKAVDKRWTARDLAGVRRSANNLGTAHFNSGDLPHADAAFNDALIAATDLGDWAGMAKIRANLALVWVLTAEGGFMLPETPPGPIEPGSPALQKAKMHYAQGLAAARRSGQGEHLVCDAFGSYRQHCAKLSD